MQVLFNILDKSLHTNIGFLMILDIFSKFKISSNNCHLRNERTVNISLLTHMPCKGPIQWALPRAVGSYCSSKCHAKCLMCSQCQWWGGAMATVAMGAPEGAPLAGKKWVHCSPAMQSFWVRRESVLGQEEGWSGSRTNGSPPLRTPDSTRIGRLLKGEVYGKGR